MCTLPKYLAQMNSPNGTDPPNPSPQQKNAKNISPNQPVWAETSMRATPMAEDHSAVAER